MNKFMSLARKVLPWQWFVLLIRQDLVRQGNLHAEKTVLCLGRRPFDKDFDELSHRVRSYSWIWLDNQRINLLLKGLLPEKCREQTFYQQTLEEFPDEWAEVIGRTRHLVESLVSRYGVACVVSANIDYWQDHAFKIACRELGIPFIVLAKEFPIHDKVRDSYRTRYSDYQASVDAVAVFGESLKDLYCEIGVLEPDQITVSGAPRLDRWRSVEPAARKRNRLAMLSFREGYGGQSGAQFLDLLTDTAKAYTKLGFEEFVVKAKNAHDAKVIRKFCKEKGLAGVQVEHDLPLYDLIPQSKAVICFNSLSVVEAMLSDSEIIVPDWIDVADDEKMLNPKDEGLRIAVSFFSNQDEMNRHLAAVSVGKGTVPESALAERRWFQSRFWHYDTRVSACRRFQDLLDEVVV
jgi:hypothetical protein